MARDGFYEVSTKTWNHEVIQSKSKRQCMGVGTALNANTWVYLKSDACEEIRAATLYVLMPDPRDGHPISVCIPCAAEYEASLLVGNVSKYIPVTPERFQAMKQELREALAELRATG